MLRAQYLENNWRCYLATTIANYYFVCCEAVRSAILATVWLLVDWSTRVTDRQTDGWWHISRLCYIFCRALKINLLYRTTLQQLASRAE